MGKDLPAQRLLQSSHCHFQSFVALSQYLSLCLDSSNDMVDFCSGQEGEWLEPGSCSAPPHIIARVGEGSLFQGKGVLSCQVNVLVGEVG